VILTPLSDRVLIKPTAAPTETASGLQLVEHWKPEQTGTVVAVGASVHPRKAEATDLAMDLFQGSDVEMNFIGPLHQTMRKAAQLLRDLTAKTPEVAVGDAVIFSWSAGHEIWVNDGDERYLLLREADILAVIEPEKEPA
jgi:co-chaperonin GroES (HSP10)